MYDIESACGSRRSCDSEEVTISRLPGGARPAFYRKIHLAGNSYAYYFLPSERKGAIKVHLKHADQFMDCSNYETSLYDSEGNLLDYTLRIMDRPCKSADEKTEILFISKGRSGN